MKKTKKGFTLVELLVVIAIIAIIAAVAIPVTIGQINKSKIKTATNEISSAFDAIELGMASDGADKLETYLESNFAKPTYVKVIKYDSSAKTLEVKELQANCGVDIAKITTGKTYNVPTDFQSMFAGIDTITWDGAGNVTIAAPAAPQT